MLLLAAAAVAVTAAGPVLTLPPHVRAGIATITFAHNCVVITKKGSRHDDYAHEEYRLAGYVEAQAELDSGTSRGSHPHVTMNSAAQSSDDEDVAALAKAISNITAGNKGQIRAVIGHLECILQTGANGCGRTHGAFG